MIKGLDDDEIEFLDLVDRTKLDADRRKNLEEQQELNDYRNRVASLQEEVLEEKLKINVSKPKVVSGAKSSQTKLLMGAVVKRDTTDKKRKASESDENLKETEQTNSKSAKLNNSTIDETDKNIAKSVGLTCIGILPGLGCYTDSSSDGCSSDSEPDTDLASILFAKHEKDE